jgi:hypothetical protein
MIYSALLELECPIVEICTAAGLPANSRFGVIILSLIDQLEAARKASTEPSGSFRPVPKLSADSVLRALAQSKLFLCDACSPQIEELFKRWRLSGIIAPADDSADTEQAAERFEQKLLQ